MSGAALREAVAAFARARADRGGTTTAPWLVTAAVATVETVGASPFTQSWAAESESVRHGLRQAQRFLWDHGGSWLSQINDPLQTLPAGLLAGGTRWLVVAAIPVLLTCLLAVIRERRSESVSARALRLYCLAVVYLVVAGYALHLVITGFAPVIGALVKVHPVPVLFVVAAVVALVRLGIGRRPAPPDPAGPSLASARWRQRITAVAAFSAAGLLLPLLPQPHLRPSSDQPAPEPATRILIADDVALLSKQSAGSVHLTAVDLHTATVMWTHETKATARVRSYRVAAEAGMVFVQRVTGADGGGQFEVLEAVSGRVAWAKPHGIVHPFASITVYQDLDKHQLVGATPAGGERLWAQPLAGGALVHTSVEVPATADAGPTDREPQHIVQVERDGTVRVRRLADGKLIQQNRRLSPDPARTRVIADHLVWLETAPEPAIVAYAVTELKQPVWTYRPDPQRGTDLTLSGCGPARVCMTDTAGTIALDAGTGRLFWQAPEGATVVGADQLGNVVLRTAAGTAVLDASGATVATFQAQQGQLLGANQILLLGPGSDDRLAVFDAGWFHLRQFGRAEISSDACGWTAAYLVCLSPSLTVWEL
jgi:hypothetical protein